MKKLLGLFFVMALLAAMPANAKGIHFGVKGGLNSTKLSLDYETVKSEGELGWFAGPTLKIDLLSFLGVQGSVFYSQNSSTVNDVKVKQKNILIPIDARLNINLVKEFGVFAATGPQFGFNLGDRDYNIFGDNEGVWDNYKNTFQLKKSMFSWNVGAGVTISKHFELSFIYNIGLGKTADVKSLTKEDKAKTKSWQLAATIFF